MNWLEDAKVVVSTNERRLAPRIEPLAVLTVLRPGSCRVIVAAFEVLRLFVHLGNINLCLGFISELLDQVDLLEQNAAGMLESMRLVSGKHLD